MQAQPIERYFTVLGLEPGASLADVKEAYRFLVQTFHEDKYPADSPYKARAHEKMVELNDAYEKLKAFFEDNPSGQPAGGWTTNAAAEGQQHSDNDDEDEDAKDWQSWQHNQQAGWQSELNDWYEADLMRRFEAKKEEEKRRRNLLVNTTRIGLGIAFVYLFMSNQADHSIRNYTNHMNDGLYRQKLQYDLATHGTANGAYILSDQQIYAQDLPAIYTQGQRTQKENGDSATSVLVLLIVGGLLTWMFASGKGKKRLNNYIEGHSLKGEAKHA